MALEDRVPRKVRTAPVFFSRVYSRTIEDSLLSLSPSRTGSWRLSAHDQHTAAEPRATSRSLQRAAVGVGGDDLRKSHNPLGPPNRELKGSFGGHTCRWC